MMKPPLAQDAIYEVPDHPVEDEIGVAADATSLEVMQAIYRNPAQPIARRMRAAQAALAYEYPRLAVIATGRGFATTMKEIARANGKSNVIDAPKPALPEPADGRVANPDRVGDIG
jgi:hypothetical protein